MTEEKILEGLRKVCENIDLTTDESAAIMHEIMSGSATNAQLGAFLTALRMKGESIDEIPGFARIMREFSNRITPNVEGDLLDTCGTGGDKVKTFNISTISALIVGWVLSR